MAKEESSLTMADIQTLAESQTRRPMMRQRKKHSKTGLSLRGRTYWMSFTANGEHYRRSCETTDRALAEVIYSKLKVQIAEGKWLDKDPAQQKTYDEMVETYFEKIKGIGKPSTYQRKEDAIRLHLDPYFSGWRLSKITSDSVDDYKQHRLSEGAAHNTILNEVRYLSHAFNTVKWRKDNPVHDAKRVKLKGRVIVRWLSREEEALLLPKTEGRLHGDLTDVVVLNLHTGLSQEEILTLKWSQIDLFRKTLQTTRGKTLKARVIPLNSTALELLKQRAKVRAISGYVFTNSVGNKHDASKLKVAFKTAVRESGIEHIRYHDLRHTFATRLIQSKVGIYAVSKLLGHADVATTAKHYAHLFSEMLHDEVGVLDAFNANSTKLAQSVGSG